ncbi:hypothetical protein DFA_05253 [Cavenderia fasciculata]|uniref:RING-type domain-containing protein n=1 Tax=Cavenderia fasciculata TaxID=261658 RepID=F4PNS0_CACFS|nr:uncharacterized protein DFA_05253 [Cavenderia fasciculata]EGG23123.1 hypothetical protein DFA_05253 [Cavenderia fasciculata]|eukprot:XP_004360974.1 hypothetical protein DFA_05253 [Cavenderia fasciculata]
MEDALFKDGDEKLQQQSVSTTTGGGGHQGHQHQGHTHELSGEHKGHEQLHATISLWLIMLSVAAQLLLLLWKHYSARTYLRASLIGMWLFPILYSIYYGYIRMIIIWTLFSLAIVYLYRLSIEQPLQRTTPKIVYMWFYSIYLISYFITFLGYIGLMCAMLQINIPILSKGSLELLFYGLYFGVLGRDFAEICSNRIASILGLGGSRLPITKASNNYCAVCSGYLDPNATTTNSASAGLMNPTSSFSDHNNDKDRSGRISRIVDRTMNIIFSKKSCKLECGHMFHLWCIKGWYLIGKHDHCPNCNEKVDIKSLSTNPWEKTDFAWGILLDVVRFLIAWNPLVIMVSKGIIYVFDK